MTDDDVIIIIPPYVGILSLLCVCTDTDFSAAEMIAAWNFACLFDYYPFRTNLLPFWRTLARVESRRRHYYRDELYTNRSGASQQSRRRGSVGSRNWGRRRCVRPYGGICILQACWRTCFLLAERLGLPTRTVNTDVQNDTRAYDPSTRVVYTEPNCGTLKVGTNYPSSRAVNTAREHGCHFEHPSCK